MAEKKRMCVGKCGREITACMGFTIVRDLIAFQDGKRTTIRELCGVCVERVSTSYAEFGGTRPLDLEKLLQDTP